MRFSRPCRNPRFAGRSVLASAFTLTEVMTSMTIFVVLMTTLLTSHLFGLKMYRISETKLTASANGRETLNRIRDEVRSAKMLAVGNGNASSFAFIPANSNQIGNALQIYASTDTNGFARYFLDTTASQLKRMSNGSARVETVANYVTNRFAFQAEDFQGTVLTNNQKNRVIRMVLEFYQWQFSGGSNASSGQKAMYDYYRLQTKLTQRALD